MNEGITQTIMDGAEQKKTVRIQYTDRKGKDSTRNVEPYEIRDGDLFAYCRKKKGIRRFKLANISSAKVTHYDYFPKWPITLQPETSLQKYAYYIGNRVFGEYEKAPLE